MRVDLLAFSLVVTRQRSRYMKMCQRAASTNLFCNESTESVNESANRNLLNIFSALSQLITGLLILHMNMSAAWVQQLVCTHRQCPEEHGVCVVQVNSIKWCANTHIQYILYTHTHKRKQIQMQILEVTQRSDRVGRDLIKNGEVRVIKHHLNPPTSCDPAISQTPTTATYTINNAVWCQAEQPSLCSGLDSLFD